MSSNACRMLMLSYPMQTLQPDIHVHAVYPPFPLSQKLPKPFQTQPRPLWSTHSADFVQRRPGHALCRGTGHCHDSGVEVAQQRSCEASIVHCPGRIIERCIDVHNWRARFEPVTTKVEEASVGPVAGREEEDQE